MLLSLGWWSEKTFYLTENNAYISLMDDKIQCKVADPDPPLRPGVDIIVDCDKDFIVITLAIIGLC